jgi:enterochelin esterase-like enzyme
LSPAAAVALGAAAMAALALAAPSSGGGQLVTRTLWSAALQRQERVLVYLPPGYSGAGKTYPLAIFLHGVPGRPEDFVTHGVVQRIDALISSGRIAPFVAAFPQGSDHPNDDNEWADSARRPGERWESYVANDVVAFVQSSYRVRTDRAGRAIAGASMGGFGAMNIALHHRDEFGVVESWSGYFNSNTPSVHDPASPAGRAYSPQLYAGALRPSLARWHPAIDFYVGSRDRFARENVAFARMLTRLHVPHRFRLVAGAGHGWPLWTPRVDGELGFLESALAGNSGGAAGSSGR